MVTSMAMAKAFDLKLLMLKYLSVHTLLDFDITWRSETAVGIACKLHCYKTLLDRSNQSQRYTALTSLKCRKYFCKYWSPERIDCSDQLVQ